jgi:hypothetical protein
MGDHKDIIRRGGGVAAFAKKLHRTTPTVRSWFTRNSIPSYVWPQICLLEIATLADLASAAPLSKRARAA